VSTPPSTIPSARLARLTPETVAALVREVVAARDRAVAEQEDGEVFGTDVGRKIVKNVDEWRSFVDIKEERRADLEVFESMSSGSEDVEVEMGMEM
jgi:hypothetical protein